MSKRKKQLGSLEAAPPAARPPETSAGRILLGALVLAALTLIAYAPLLHAGFVWDDDTMLTGNALIRAADGLHGFWATKQAPDYWPMTSTTLWIEWRLWGLHALGYHATNVALHLVEAGLLWAILRRLRIPGAYFAALVYAVHPVNVESVAWIAQRKNLMAMLFYLASISCFIEVERVVPNARGDVAGGTSALGTTRSTFYGLSLLAFACAMLSKGSAAMLPVVLIGLIVWRRRFTGWDGLRLAPFFAIGAGLTLVDIWFQKHGGGEVIRHAGFVERLLGAGSVVWFYLWKALWPAHLIFVYPQWTIQPGDLRWWLPLAAAVAMTVGLHRWGRRGRPALFAWLYFCVMLVPAMGLTDVYFMKYSLVADHYQQMAIVGVIGFVAAGWGAARERAIARGGLPGGAGWTLAAAAAVVLLTAASARQARLYHDSETLFRDTLAHNPSAWMAHGNLGMDLAADGRNAEAIAEFHAALQLKPDYPEALNNLGILMRQLGHNSEATADYREALRLRPEFPEAHNDLSELLTAEGRLPEAIAEAQEALRLKHDYADAENNLGNALRAARRPAEAVQHYRRAVQLEPAGARVENNLAAGLLDLGQVAEAIAHFQRAIQLDPSYIGARDNLRQVLHALGRNQEADAQAEAIRRLQSGGAAAP